MMKKYTVTALTFLVFLCNHLFGQETAQFFNLQWRDSQNEITEANLDDTINIFFETRNIPENEMVAVEIWRKRSNELLDLIKEEQVTVKNNTGVLTLTVALDLNNENTTYFKEIAENGYTIVDYVFIIKHNDINISSNVLAILGWADHLIVDKLTGEPVRNKDFLLLTPKGKFLPGRTDDDGRAKVRNLREIGNYTFIM